MGVTDLAAVVWVAPWRPEREPGQLAANTAAVVVAATTAAAERALPDT